MRSSHATRPTRRLASPVRLARCPRRSSPPAVQTALLVRVGFQTCAPRVRSVRGGGAWVRFPHKVASALHRAPPQSAKSFSGAHRGRSSPLLVQTAPRHVCFAISVQPTLSLEATAPPRAFNVGRAFFLPLEGPAIAPRVSAARTKTSPVRRAAALANRDTGTVTRVEPVFTTCRAAELHRPSL